jgi:integrase
MTAGMKVTIDAKKQADVDKWADYATARIGEGTVRTYKSHLISFFAWLEDKPFNKCNIEDNITYMVKNGYAKITVNNRLAANKQFCKWYCPRHDTKDPSIDVPFFNRKETQPKKRRFLTSEEYAKILAIADKGIERDTIEFLANTGLRRAEYLTFHVNAINKKGTHFSIMVVYNAFPIGEITPTIFGVGASLSPGVPRYRPSGLMRSGTISPRNLSAMEFRSSWYRPSWDTPRFLSPSRLTVT